MKRYLAILLLFYCLFIALPLNGNVRVLSICIAEYPKESGWNSLGADNDARLVKQLFNDVTVVSNERATYNQILSELNILNRNVNRGDTVIVHFSGHGQQILSETSSEEADLVDEALVPYDAAKRKSATYNGRAHITDNVFGDYISGIRNAVGPNGLVIAVIDACHSDSMDKDANSSDEVYRGTDEIFGAETLAPDSVANLRKLYDAPDESSVLTSAELSNAIFISACGTHQRNYEIKVEDTPYGSLTYYFCKAYETKGIANLNEFLSELYNAMSSDKTMRFHGQSPVIRNTIGWVAPHPSIYEPTDSPMPKEDDHMNTYWLYVVGVFAVIIIAIILVICRKRK